jgi:ABC-type branched-subunit amino acid transport system permease subunit
VLLPFALGALGLGITSASEAVIFAMACMALNILVGYTGLVSFGHGAWFGLAAYAAAMAQRELFKGRSCCRSLMGVGRARASRGSSASSSCAAAASTSRSSRSRSPRCSTPSPSAGPR